MPEVATISNSVQIGAESTPGTSVAASKLLSYLSIALAPEINFATSRPMGQKPMGASAANQSSSTLDLNAAVGSYSEFIYPFCSVLANVTPSTVDTSAKLWDFSPAARTEDTIKTFTVEQGSATRAQKATYGVVNGIEIGFSRTDGVSLTGSGYAQNLIDNITITPTPTAVEDAPMQATHLDVYVDSTSGTLGTTKLTRDFSSTLRIGDRTSPIWPINSANASFVAHVETEPTFELEMTLEADSAGMAFYANAIGTNPTQFIRMAAVSTVLAGAATAKYQMLIDLAGKVTAINAFDDVDGVKTIAFTFSAVYDATWTKFMRVQLQNKTATL